MKTETTKHAILDLKGATCSSCAYTIEHHGRKIQGVKDIKVDAGNSEIQVDYEGNPGSLERIVQIVKTIGYDADIRWDSISD